LRLPYNIDIVTIEGKSLGVCESGRFSKLRGEESQGDKPTDSEVAVIVMQGTLVGHFKTMSKKIALKREAP